MNYADKMELESRLMSRIADWMQAHGRVLYDRQRSRPRSRKALLVVVKKPPILI